MLAHQLVEQHLVTVVKLGQEDPLTHVGLALAELFVAARNLLVKRLDGRWQKTMKTEMFSLCQCESRAPVQLRVIEHVHPS